MLNPTALSKSWMSMGTCDAGCQPNDIAFGGCYDTAFDNVFKVMQRSSPGGCTPLTRHLAEIHTEIMSMKADLEMSGRKVCIVLATDGLPSDNQGYMTEAAKSAFVNGLRAFVGLPIWVVIRLCTDEDDVCEFYNELDSQVELNFEVIDDFKGEAKVTPSRASECKNELAAAAPKRSPSFVRAKRAGAAGERPSSLLLLCEHSGREERASARTASFFCASGAGGSSGRAPEQLLLLCERKWAGAAGERPNSLLQLCERSGRE
jgi:hypothetical protein